MSSPDRRIEVAEAILKQLGGMRTLKLMVGGSDAYALGSADYDVLGVQFKIKAIGIPRINKVRIVLNGLDLYNVEVFYCAKGKDAKLVNSAKDIFGDQLVQCLEGFCNLCFQVPRIMRYA